MSRSLSSAGLDVNVHAKDRQRKLSSNPWSSTTNWSMPSFDAREIEAQKSSPNSFNPGSCAAFHHIWATMRSHPRTLCPPTFDPLRKPSFWTACSLFGSRVYCGGFERGRKTAENVALGDEKTTMALVLSGWGGPGRIADDSVCAWESSGDSYADQDPCRAGPGNEHALADTHSPAQPHTYTLTGRFCHRCCANPKPGLAESQPTAYRHPATGSHRTTGRTPAYLDAEPAANSRAHPPPSAHSHGSCPATACPAARRGVGHGGWLCAWVFTAG